MPHTLSSKVWSGCSMHVVGPGCSVHVVGSGCSMRVVLGCSMRVVLGCSMHVVGPGLPGESLAGFGGSS